MVSNGEITQNCYALISDIDRISAALKPLADADVPVLWRPLPEAGGGWYWWAQTGQRPISALESDVHPDDGISPSEQSALGVERTEQQLSGGQQPV